MMNGGRTCPLNKPYHDTGSPFNGSCSPGWRRLWAPWASATSGWSGCWSWCGWRSRCPTAGAGGVVRWRIGRRWARAFLAKAVLDMPTTRALVERLRTEGLLRRLCGWEGARAVPSEATFSRAFAAFAESDLPGRLHEALLDRTLEGHLAGHVSRDSTAIPGRESPAPKRAPTGKRKRRRGRPRKGEQRPKEPAPPGAAGVDDAAGDAEGPAEGLRHRCQAQRQGASGELDRLQLHLDAIDGGIPVSCLLTSASVHDSQAAIPLARLTASRAPTASTT